MADIQAWLLGAGTLAVGATFTVGTEALRRGWSRKDAAESVTLTAGAERQRRVEERSEAAAIALLGVLDDVRHRFKGSYTYGSAPDSDDLTRALRRHSVELHDDQARVQFDWIADAIEYADTAGQLLSQVPSVVAYAVWNDGREILGAILRGEAVGEHPKMKAYEDAIHEYWDEISE